MKDNLRRANWLFKLFPDYFYMITISGYYIIAQGHITLEKVERLSQLIEPELTEQGWIKFVKGKYEITLT
jgi:hypothetical protein